MEKQINLAKRGNIKKILLGGAVLGTTLFAKDVFSLASVNIEPIPESVNLTGYVPYIGATQGLDLGTNNLNLNGNIIIEKSGSGNRQLIFNNSANTQEWTIRELNSQLRFNHIDEGDLLTINEFGFVAPRSLKTQSTGANSLWSNGGIWANDGIFCGRLTSPLDARIFAINPNYTNPAGELPSRSYLSALNGSTGIITNVNGTVGERVVIGYAGATWLSALEIANTGIGYGTLQLMKSGGSVFIGGLNNGLLNITSGIVGVDTTSYLKLDQTTPQTIINGIPLLCELTTAITLPAQLVNKAYVDQAVTALGARYYMIDTASGIADYKLTQINPSTNAEATDAHASVINNEYIRGWISPVAGAPSRLITGVYEWHIYAQQTGGTGKKDLRLYWELVERKADTTEVVIATSSLSNQIGNTRAEYQLSLTVDSDYEIASDSYVLGKIYTSVAGSGGDPSISLFYEGNSDSHWEIPANLDVLTDNLVPYEGARANVDLGTYNLTTTASVTGNYIYTKSGSLYFYDAVSGDVSGELIYTDDVGFSFDGITSKVNINSLYVNNINQTAGNTATFGRYVNVVDTGLGFEREFSQTLNLLTNNLRRWYWSSTGHYIPHTTNVYDIGSTTQKIRVTYSNKIDTDEITLKNNTFSIVNSTGSMATLTIGRSNVAEGIITIIDPDLGGNSARIGGYGIANYILNDQGAGNFGIGNETPSEKLDVTGNINATLKVKEKGFNLVPAGTIFPFAGGSIPNGFLLCDGSAVSRSTYSELFSAISTLWGVGNGTTTFNIPNLVQKFLYGNDEEIGTTGGTNDLTLTVNQIPAHSHTYNNLSGGSGGQSGSNVGTTSTNTGNTGGGQPFDNRPAFATVIMIIKY